MPGSSSVEVRTHRVAVDWPVDDIHLRVEVVEPRPLTALEWVVERVLDTFGELPPVGEVAAELGLGTTVFVDVTLDTLKTLGAVEQDAEQVRLTARGRELFRRGRIDGAPQRHGMRLLFDPLGDRFLTGDPEALRRLPASPVVAPGERPAPRQDVGLDAVRSLAVARRERFLGPEAQIRDREIVGVHAAWLPIDVDVRIEGEQLRLDAPALDETGRRLLVRRAAQLPAIAGLAQRYSRGWGARDHGPALGRVAGLTVTEAEPADRVRALLSRARREVVLHPVWLGMPSIAKHLGALLQRGVSVIEAGGDAGLVHWSGLANGGAAWRVRAGGAASERPAALVVDGRACLVLDRRPIRIDGGEDVVPLEVLAEGEGTAAEALRGALVAGIGAALATLAGQAATAPKAEADFRQQAAAALATDEVRLLVAASALDPSCFDRLDAALRRRLTGPTLLVALRGVERLAGAGDARSSALETALLRAAIASGDEAGAVVLLGLAPDGPALGAAIDACVTCFVPEGPRGLEVLARLAAPLRAPAWALSDGFRRRTRAIYGAAGLPLEAAVRLARDLMPADEAKAWATAACGEPPAEVARLADWVAARAPLRPLIGDLAVRRAAEAWTRAVTPRVAPERLPEAVRTGIALLDPERVAATLASGHDEGLPARIERLCGIADASAGLADAQACGFERTLLARLREALAATAFGVDEATGWVAPVRTRLAGRSAWLDAFDAWAAKGLEAVRAPGDAAAIAGWLYEVCELVEPFGDGILRACRKHVQRFAAELSRERARKSEVWTTLADTWELAGLPPQELALALAASSGAAGASRKTAKKGGRGRS
jgi:hypothetical protein